MYGMSCQQVNAGWDATHLYKRMVSGFTKEMAADAGCLRQVARSWLARR